MFPHQKLDRLIGRLEAEIHDKPDDPALRLGHTRALLSKGLFHGGGEPYCAQALRQVRRVLGDDEGNPEALVLAGMARIGMGRPDAARQDLDGALRLAPDRADLHLAMGALFRAEGDRHHSIGHLEKACRLEPSAWEPHFFLGQTLAERSRELGHPPRLVERAQFHLVLALKNGLSQRLQPAAIRELGVTCLLTGRYREAESLFQRLHRDPDQREKARYHLGQVAYALSKYKNAIHHLRTYLDRHPTDGRAMAIIARSYLQLGELARAREVCHQALLLDSGDLEARYTLGCTVLEEGDPWEAIRLFRLILKEHPFHLPSYLELVRTRRRGGDLGWLVQALHREVGDFDKLPPASHGGDPRVGTMERIGVLLDELKAVGPSSVGPVLAAISKSRDEALRFLLWETSVGLAASQAADDVALKLRDPGRHFGAGLGRQACVTAHLLPEPLLTRGLSVSEEDLKREAVNRHGPAVDVACHRSNVEKVRQDARAWQALLLLAIARRLSRSGRSLLQRWAETADPQMAMVARVGLAVHGDPSAVGEIRQAARASGRLDQVDRLLAGLAPPRGASQPRSLGHGESAHCTTCGRTADMVNHLMAGGNAVLCDSCVVHIGRNRDRLPAPDEARCQLCGRGGFEARGIHHYVGVEVCNHCLELSLGLIEREEVDRFLASW